MMPRAPKFLINLLAKISIKSGGIFMNLRVPSRQSQTVGIIAGSQGHWVVNQELKMTEILLRSC